MTLLRIGGQAFLAGAVAGLILAAGVVAGLALGERWGRP